MSSFSNMPNLGGPAVNPIAAPVSDAVASRAAVQAAAAVPAPSAPAARPVINLTGEPDDAAGSDDDNDDDNANGGHGAAAGPQSASKQKKRSKAVAAALKAAGSIEDMIAAGKKVLAVVGGGGGSSAGNGGGAAAAVPAAEADSSAGASPAKKPKKPATVYPNPGPTPADPVNQKFADHIKASWRYLIQLGLHRHHRAVELRKTLEMHLAAWEQHEWAMMDLQEKIDRDQGEYAAAHNDCTVVFHQRRDEIVATIARMFERHIQESEVKEWALVEHTKNTDFMVARAERADELVKETRKAEKKIAEHRKSIAAHRAFCHDNEELVEAAEREAAPWWPAARALNKVKNLAEVAGPLSQVMSQIPPRAAAGGAAAAVDAAAASGGGGGARSGNYADGGSVSGGGAAAAPVPTWSTTDPLNVLRLSLAKGEEGALERLEALEAAGDENGTRVLREFTDMRFHWESPTLGDLPAGPMPAMFEAYKRERTIAELAQRDAFVLSTMLKDGALPLARAVELLRSSEAALRFAERRAARAAAKPAPAAKGKRKPATKVAGKRKSKAAAPAEPSAPKRQRKDDKDDESASGSAAAAGGAADVDINIVD